MQEQSPQDTLIAAINAEDPDGISQALDSLHPSEIADLLESLPQKDRYLAWGFIPHEDKGDVLSHAQDPVRAGLLEQMPPAEVADVTKSLDADDIADILNDLPKSVVDDVLFSMDAQDRQRLASVLSYPEDTAGGLMNPDIISVRADVTLDVVSRYLRQKGQLTEQTASLMVVDRENAYLGLLPLIEILTKSPESTVGEFLVSEVNFSADTPAREVARVFEQRDIFSAAVVDADNKLLGVITVDDVLDVIQEQAEQTMRNMDGLADDDMFSPLLVSAKHRALWLGINLMAAFLASYVVGRFEQTIQQLVALAVLMPVVASMGGVAGSQTLNITIRGLATGQITRLNSRLLLNKEVGVGILNGITWALVVAVVAIFWFENYALGAIISLAMVINLVIAAYSGVIIPLFLKKIGIDPAIAGGVLLITVTDVVGFATFLGLASLYLNG
ncbi:MAG: magnesium transporter [Gammaproteobacteria bacterium]|nr:magnesium transporter [Gammaproteobacteria bacterium]